MQVSMYPRKTRAGSGYVNLVYTAQSSHDVTKISQSLRGRHTKNVVTWLQNEKPFIIT
jgi:hypothetical protein